MLLVLVRHFLGTCLHHFQISDRLNNTCIYTYISSYVLYVMGIDNLYKDMEQYICGLYAQLSCACVLSNLEFFTLCQEIKIKCTNHKISTNWQKTKSLFANWASNFLLLYVIWWIKSSKELSAKTKWSGASSSSLNPRCPRASLRVSSLKRCNTAAKSGRAPCGKVLQVYNAYSVNKAPIWVDTCRISWVDMCHFFTFFFTFIPIMS